MMKLILVHWCVLALSGYGDSGGVQAQMGGNGDLIVVVGPHETLLVNGLELTSGEHPSVAKLSLGGELLWQTEVPHCPGSRFQLEVREDGTVFLHGSLFDDVAGSTCFYLVTLRPDGVVTNLVQGSKPVGT